MITMNTAYLVTKRMSTLIGRGPKPAAATHTASRIWLTRLCSRIVFETRAPLNWVEMSPLVSKASFLSY